MRATWLALATGAMFFLPALSAQGGPGPELRVDYSNPGLTPSAWTLVLHPDGSAHFHSEPGDVSTALDRDIESGPVDRQVRLSQEYADHVFETVRQHHQLKHMSCESHLKVAFQGWKKITYSGPDGQGTCEFNYSRDKDIEQLGESFVAVAATIIEGARLELFLQHDPLGLDHEMGYLREASQDGRLQQMCAIRGILQKLEDDPSIMERVRKQARQLLEQSSK